MTPDRARVYPVLEWVTVGPLVTCTIRSGTGCRCRCMVPVDVTEYGTIDSAVEAGFLMTLEAVFDLYDMHSPDALVLALTVAWVVSQEHPVRAGWLAALGPAFARFHPITEPAR